jgi:sugar phosphate permease
MLVQGGGVALIAAGIGLSFFNVGGILGRFLWGFVGDVLGSGPPVLSALFAVAFALLLALPWMTGEWPTSLIYAYLGILGVVAAGWNGVFLGELLRQAPSGESARVLGGGLVFGFAGALVFLGAFITTYRIAGTYAVTSWTVTFAALCGLAFALKSLALTRQRPGDAQGLPRQ